MQIFKHETYADDNERIVHAKMPLDDEAPRFFGVGHVPTGTDEFGQFEFVIPGETVEEAFANYDDALALGTQEAEKQVAARKAKERSKPKIIQAAHMPSVRRFR
jgi:hypothetical protein